MYTVYVCVYIYNNMFLSVSTQVLQSLANPPPRAWSDHWTHGSRISSIPKQHHLNDPCDNTMMRNDQHLAAPFRSLTLHVSNRVCVCVCVSHCKNATKTSNQSYRQNQSSWTHEASSSSLPRLVLDYRKSTRHPSKKQLVAKFPRLNISSVFSDCEMSFFTLVWRPFFS